jgi:hypothetical protein
VLIVSKHSHLKGTPEHGSPTPFDSDSQPLHVAGFIEQARKRMSERPELSEEPENFLEAMLAAQREDGTFTDEEIIGNVFTLLVAGEDTTAHTLAWTSWFLAQHADVQGETRRCDPGTVCWVVVSADDRSRRYSVQRRQERLNDCQPRPAGRCRLRDLEYHDGEKLPAKE